MAYKYEKNLNNETEECKKSVTKELVTRELARETNSVRQKASEAYFNELFK